MSASSRSRSLTRDDGRTDRGTLDLSFEFAVRRAGDWNSFLSSGTNVAPCGYFGLSGCEDNDARSKSFLPAFQNPQGDACREPLPIPLVIVVTW